MLARIETCTVVGVDARPVQVEVSLTSGLPSFTVVGLAQGAVREGRERVASALRTTGLGLPNRRITVNLAPADVRKTGTGFDLPLALGILAAAGHIPGYRADRVLALGELGLDGTVRGVSGVIPAALLARASGRRLVVSAADVPAALLVPGIEVVGVETLVEAIEACTAHGPRAGRGRGHVAASCGGVATGRRAPGGGDSGGREGSPERRGPDLSEVSGQHTARRALEIAAAGDHNLLFVGPPGVGKTMLARRLPGIMPPLGVEEALDVARIASAAGHPVEAGLLHLRPFRAPHHSVSYAGLLGGGVPVRPGEISLAHRGVLFLDELPEFRRDVLEALRQPLEEGEVVLARAAGSVRLPARFALIAAMNPCPCGWRGDGTDRCLCDDGAVARYRARVSGPLLDRIDLHVELPTPASAIASAGEGSAVVAARVAVARRRRAARLETTVTGRAGWGKSEGEGVVEVGSTTSVEPDGMGLLRAGVARAGLSMRGRDRVLRVARTIADLADSEAVRAEHVAEALQYRGVPSA